MLHAVTSNQDLPDGVRMVLCMAWSRRPSTCPTTLKLELARVARETGRSEADLIRDGIRLAVARQQPPLPTIGILVSEDPSFAERVDEHLAGFGQQ